MRITFKQLIILFIAFHGLSTVEAQKLDHVQGEVLVEVRNDQGMNSLIQDLSKDAVMRSSALQVRQIMTEPMNLWVLKTNPNLVNEIHLLNTVLKNKNALLAQQNHISQLRNTPNDPNFDNQWQYINTGQSGGVVGADMDMDLAWDVTTGGLTLDGDSIVVCVIDDGIRENHPDLGNNLWVNHQEIPDNGIDDDGNNYIDDVRGWSAYSDSDNVYVGGGHGTPVAGIVGAKGNNEIGVAGVNWDVKLMIVRGGSPESTALAAYGYPYTMRKLYNETNGEKGAFVVATNASWGVDFGSPEDAPIWCDFYNLLGEVGILNFGATINGNTNVDIQGDLPTTCESNYLVSVTNMNRNDEKVSGAGYGERHIDLGAFGAQTYTINSSAYGNFGGTSGATPHVAGTAALLYATDCMNFMELTKSDPAQAALVIKDCILHGVDYNESLQGITTTGGRLNANNAVQNLISTCDDCTSAFGGDVGEITDTKGTLTWYDNGSLGTTSIRYKVIDDTNWIELGDVESGYQFEGLLACSTYEYQTKTTCEGNPEPEYTYSRIFKTDGCCEIPSGVSINLNGQMATIQWEDVLAASNFVVEWKSVTDSVWMRADLGEDNTFLLNDILECQFYEVRIKSECDASNNESEFSEIFNINGECGECTRDFCEFSAKNISDEWIESVEIEGVFLNVSGVNVNGYGSYLGQFAISLNKEEDYTINLAPGYDGTEFDEFFAAYIDYNQNGEFEESEAIFISDQSTQMSVSGNFTVPADAIPGICRMRVIMRFDNLNGPCDESGFEYGEIEEYCVTIVGDEICPTTFESSVIDSTETSITFELEPNDLIESYLILIQVNGAQDFDTIYSSSNQIVVPDLTKCTDYLYASGFICDGELYVNTIVTETNTTCIDAVSEINNEFISLNIYPNPSYGDLIIDFGNPMKIEGTIDLISNEGRRIINQRTIERGATNIFIEGQEIPAGVYFLKVATAEDFVVRKWVKY